MSPKPEQPPSTGIDLRRSDSLANVYSNHTHLESSGWDVKIIFGEIDQSIGPNTVVQHTAITMPWGQAKILAYFLQIHLAAHEVALGRVQIAPNIIPNIPEPGKEEKDLPKAKQLYEIWTKLHDDFMAANPEAVKT
jgi:hypothetical protein